MGQHGGAAMRVMLFLVGSKRLFLLLLCVGSLSACLQESSDSVRRGFDASFDGDVVVSVEDANGAPLSTDYYQLSDTASPPNGQFLEVVTSEPFAIRVVIEDDQLVSIRIEAWREENAFIGKTGVTEGHATFEIDESAGTVAELVLERGMAIDELRLMLDRDGDGSFDAEIPPTEWAEGRERPLIALRLPTLHYFLRQAWPSRPPAAIKELIAAD